MKELIEKVSHETTDGVEQNIEKIADMFPSCITETVNNEGNITKGVNFAILQQLLSKDVIGGREAFEFSWVGKRASIREATKAINKTLRPVPEESKNWDTTNNLYIEGDNLDVLKLLQESYLGKIKMIYIDPPYNTGNDFIYQDDFKLTREEYDEQSGALNEEGERLVKNSNTNGRYHSDWCSMIYPRLYLARTLLSNDGVIFISIDDREVDNLRKICDEIFGSKNLVAEIPWQSRASIQNDTDFSINHEYILVYAKKRRMTNRRLKPSNEAQWRNTDSFVCQPLPLDEKGFENPDNDPRGPWKADPFDAPNVRPNLTYPIKNPNTGEVYLPPKGRHWRCNQAQYEQLFSDGRILFGKTGKSKPQLKVFYEEKKDYGSVDNSWFSSDRIGTTTDGTKEQQQLFGGSCLFDKPKPVSLLLKLMKLARLPKDAIVLDFFSGSSTTAHALMQLNAEEKTNRKFIMVQLPEKTSEDTEAFKQGFENICDIAKKRIHLAGKEIELKFAGNQNALDTGFRVFKVDSSNLNDLRMPANAYEQGRLFELENNIKEDRSDLDLLFGCILNWGVPPSLPYQVENIEGHIVHNYNNGDLIACFDENISNALIREIAKLNPLRVVFRDSCFENSADKINVTEVFARYAPNSKIKVI